jgi:hypothetical protein
MNSLQDDFLLRAGRNLRLIATNDVIAPMLVGIEPSSVGKVAVAGRLKFFRDNGSTNPGSFVARAAIAPLTSCK